MASRIRSISGRSILRSRVVHCNKNPVVLSVPHAVPRYFSSDHKISKVSDHYVEKTPITAQLWEMRKLAQQEADSGTTSTKNNISKTEEESLLTKTSSDSRLTVRYNFKTDAKLRDLYIDPLGHVIIGKLFEDLDALAGNVATSHVDDHNANTERLSLVTASVDKIAQKHPLCITDDIELSGQVIWVGKSSLVIMMTVNHIQANTSSSNEAISPELAYNKSVWTSFFTYVARQRSTGKAALVNKLQLSNAFEQQLFNQRNALVVSRSAASKALSQANVNTKEMEEIRDKLVESGSAMEDMPALAHPNAVLMKSTTLENSLVCQPQNVNTAGKVFGGFIMHKAYDLALATCYTFAGAYPIFLESDKIAFRRPVEVGDLLRLKSRVIFTSDDPIYPKVVIEVKCQVISPEK